VDAGKGWEIAGTIALVYYLDKPGLLSQIVEAQHKFEKVVTCSMHVHLTSARYSIGIKNL
jgi:metal-responsive CopG/Arc/MetJ family transcriptional regulator